MLDRMALRMPYKVQVGRRTDLPRGTVNAAPASYFIESPDSYREHSARCEAARARTISRTKPSIDSWRDLVTRTSETKASKHCSAPLSDGVVVLSLRVLLFVLHVAASHCVVYYSAAWMTSDSASYFIARV